MLLLAPLAAYVPLATLAAVLFVVAYNMGEWREIGGIWRLDWADKSVWMITFALTVMADLTVAVEVGHGARGAALHLPRHRHDQRRDRHAGVHRRRPRRTSCRTSTCRPYVTILRIHGPFLFGMTDKLADVDGRPVGVRADRHPAAAEHDRHRRDRPARAGALRGPLRKSGRTLILCGARHQPAKFLQQAEFVEHVGRENIVPHVQAALARARALAPRLQG